MRNAITATIFSIALLASVGVAQERSDTLRRPGQARSAPAPDVLRLGAQSLYGGNRFPTKQAGRFDMPPLMAPTTAVAEIGNGVVPENFRRSDEEAAQPIPEGPDRPGQWSLSTYLWQAPNTFSHPRYFEDVMLERHGHERFPALQPLVSGARFYATFPMLPYLATVRPPCDCEYSLGYFRPGACAPALLQRPPYQRNAVLVEAATVAGAIGVFP